jgi:hypothetical protein
LDLYLKPRSLHVIRSYQCSKFLTFGYFLRLQWSDKTAYKETLLKLAGLFKKNFETFTDYKIGEDSKLTEDILAAGPIF